MKTENERKAQNLFGELPPADRRKYIYQVEYDHPFQSLAIGWDDTIHIVDGEHAHFAICGTQDFSHVDSGYRSRSIYAPHAPVPCPRCFLSGDLSALRISEVDGTESYLKFQASDIGISASGPSDAIWMEFPVEG